MDDALRKIRPYRMEGYAVVESDLGELGPTGWLEHHPQWSADYFARAKAYAAWCELVKPVALEPLFSDNLPGDVVIIPAPLHWPLRWRDVVRAWWLNIWRRRANRQRAKYLAAYFSPENVSARARGNAR